MASSAIASDALMDWNVKRAKAHPTFAEKLDLLVLRDKVLRIAQQRQTGRSSGDQQNEIVVVGTCTEMCPEKERYERESQGRVSVFERNRKMIKDFSRQAADQEMPLPSDLRTPAALRTTLSHLLCVVISQLPDDPAGTSGWYDFVWRRIREIRKEITQQRLKGMAICEMMEEMARFHIIAFHLCCETDKNQFDVRLNLENLNDCLATLSRLYADLEAQNFYSPNIAEFKSYELLLRVWTGKLDLVKTTAEIARLPLEIQTSDELGFIWEVISACNNQIVKEYVDLLTKADVLTACLMHLSLPILQARCLNNISVASGSRAKAVSIIPVAAFSTLIGLETEAELVNFCEYHELLYDHQAQSISLKPGMQISRDPRQFPRLRSATVIEPKLRRRNIAEWIAKKSLTQIAPQNVIEINSFDDNGRYIGIDPTAGLDRNVVVKSATTTLRLPKPSAAHNDMSTPTTFADARRVPEPQSAATFRPFVPDTRYISSAFTVPGSPRSTHPVSPALIQEDKSRKRSRSAFDDAADGPNPVTSNDAKRRDSESLRFPLPGLDSSIARPSPGSKLDASSPVSSLVWQLSGSESPVNEKVYPPFTHLSLIKARSVCQGAVVRKAVFVAWREYLNQLRRPSDFFGQSSVKGIQQNIAREKLKEEQDRLLWTPFPIRSQILHSENFKFNRCVLAVCCVADDASDIPRWMQAKFGIGNKDCSSGVLTYETDDRLLQIIWLNYSKDAKSCDQLLAQAANDLGGIVYYCGSRQDVCTAADILKSVRKMHFADPDVPVGLFCEDSDLGADDLEEMKARRLWDYHVEDKCPSPLLNAALWDVIGWIITNRRLIPLPLASTISRTVAQICCDFFHLTRDIEREISTTLSESLLVGLWNNVVQCHLEDFATIVELTRNITVPHTIASSDNLRQFLTLNESSLWNTATHDCISSPFIDLLSLADDKCEISVVARAVAAKVMAVANMVIDVDSCLLKRVPGDCTAIFKDYLELASLHTEREAPSEELDSRDEKEEQEEERMGQSADDRSEVKSTSCSTANSQDIMEVVDNFLSNKADLEGFFDEMRNILDHLDLV